MLQKICINWLLVVISSKLVNPDIQSKISLWTKFVAHVINLLLLWAWLYVYNKTERSISEVNNTGMHKSGHAEFESSTIDHHTLFKSLKPSYYQIFLRETFVRVVFRKLYLWYIPLFCMLVLSFENNMGHFVLLLIHWYTLGTLQQRPDCNFLVILLF